MGAAWEWRGFRPTADGEGIEELVAGLCNTVGWEGPPEERAEQDTYMVLRGQPHNFKLRAGCLEVKWLLARSPGGFGLWQDKEVWAFPLGAAVQSRLVGYLGVQRRDAPTISSPEQLTDWLRSMTRVTLSTLTKRRVRLVRGGVRVEVATVFGLPGPPLFSICVDGYQLPAVRSMVDRLALHNWGRSLSYVDVLVELTWWLPVWVEREVAAARVAESRPVGLELL